MLLEDLAHVVAHGELHPDALLQLDFKENQPLDDVAVEAFGRIVAPMARHLILSSGDAEAVRRLSEGVGGLRTGHDPCHFGALERLRETRDFAGFLQGALAEAPRADTIYLHHSVVLAAAEAGHDLVERVHRTARRVDAYTIPRADAEGLAVARRLLDLRVDQITTDDPDGLGRALA
jgi:glycerophosphoryl diester phosphodiesterase